MKLNSGKLPKKFWAQVEVHDGCWVWQGTPKDNGYGRFTLNGRRNYVHRITYEACHDTELPPKSSGMVIDHKCCNRLCVNPSHLEMVSVKENTLRGASAATELYCKNGHYKHPDNVYEYPQARLGRGYVGLYRECTLCTGRKITRRLSDEERERLGWPVERKPK